MTTHVFTYGSLMFPAVWTLVVAGRYAQVPAHLDGHARFAIRDETYPGMVAKDGERVDGVLYLDVHDEDVRRLDAFEGDDYRRAPVTLACDDGVPRVADTYLYRATDRLRTSAWDPESFDLQRFIDGYCHDRVDR